MFDLLNRKLYVSIECAGAGDTVFLLLTYSHEKYTVHSEIGRRILLLGRGILTVIYSLSSVQLHN